MKQGSLTKKLVLFFVVFGLTIAFIISMLQQVSDYYIKKQETVRNITEMVETLSPAIQQSLWQLDFEQTQLQLQALKQHPYVSYVKLEISQFDDIEIGLSPTSSPRLSIEKILMRDKTLLGRLTVDLDKQRLENNFWLSFFQNAFNNITVITVTAIVLYFFVRSLITRRLYTLVEKLRNVSISDFRSNDLDIVTPSQKKNFDEIDELNLTIKKLWNLRQSLIEELALSEERWRLAIESTSDGLWDWDIETGVVFYSDNWKTMLGFEPSDIQPHISEWERLAHPDDIGVAKQDLNAHFSGESGLYLNTHRMRCKDGSYKWVLDRGSVISRADDGTPLRMVGTHTDIHELVEAKNQLKIAALVYQQAAEGMMITNEKVEIIDVNEAFCDITGYSKDEVKGRKPNLLSSGEQSYEFYKGMWKDIKHNGTWNGELTNKNKAGQNYIEWLSITAIKDDRQNLIGYIGIFSDITKRKEQENLIYHQANYDSLTNLANRRLFLDLLERKIKLAKRESGLVWLMYLDLDNFKEVNDSLGHDYGDALLEQWTQRVRTHLRESDIFARLGGDEFAIVFCQVNDDQTIDKIANHITGVLNQPFKIRESEVFVTVSIGIVQFPNDADTSSSLMRAADQTLYRAKKAGKNQHAYYTPELQKALDRKVELSMRMRKSHAAGHFEVYYQPIVNLSDNQVLKAEALLRWNEPEEGFISPAHFIPVAEETGFIDSLTEFVVKEVLLKQLSWQKKYTTTKQISINISPLEFRSLQKNKTQWFEELKASGLMTRSVLFEITEGVLVDNDESILNQLLEFRDLGIEVAIDDFGTGYSSLSYLHKFDIDYLKIDKQFVDDIVEKEQIKALCEAIIVMAHKLGLKVIAEGVEKESQAEILRDLKCDFYQGYLCAPAITANEFEERFFIRND